MYLNIYLVCVLIILFTLVWIYFRDKDGENLQEELEDDDDTHDIRDTDIAKVINN